MSRGEVGQNIFTYSAASKNDIAWRLLSLGTLSKKRRGLKKSAMKKKAPLVKEGNAFYRQWI